MPSLSEWKKEAEKFEMEQKRLSNEIEVRLARLNELTEDLMMVETDSSEELDEKLKRFDKESERLSREVNMYSLEFNKLLREFIEFTDQCPVDAETLRKFNFI